MGVSSNQYEANYLDASNSQKPISSARELAQSLSIDSLPFPKPTLRALKRCGCETLLDVVQLEPTRISSVLPAQGTNEIFALYDAFEEDSARFIHLAKKLTVRKAETSKQPREQATAQAVFRERPPQPQFSYGEATQKVPINRRPYAGSVVGSFATRTSSFENRRPSSSATSFHRLPHDECGTRLGRFEVKAKKALDLLDDHQQEALVMESFPILGIELAQAVTDIETIWSRYKEKSSEAFSIMRDCLPNAFLVVCIQIAQKSYTGENLWSPFFKRLCCNNINVQTSIRHFLIQSIEDRGFPVYKKEEESQRYINTVLLHAGLNAPIWEGFWRDLLLPKAEELENSIDGLKPRGIDLLNLAREESGKYQVKGKRIQKLLKHTPPSMLCPILESALSVARQLNQSEDSPTEASNGKQFTLLSGHTLPETAIEGLSNILNESGKPKEHTKDGVQRQRRELLYLPEPELRLNTSCPDKPFELYWYDKQFFANLIGCHVLYYLNNQQLRDEEILSGINRGLLNSVCIPIEPQSTIEIEIQLVRQNGEDGDCVSREILATHSTSFIHSHPKTFEFLLASDEVWRLRKPGRRIRRSEQIAYVLPDGYSISPQGGMRKQNEERIDLASGGRLRVEYFQASPGFNGQILSPEGNPICSWHDSFSIEIARTHRIGYNASGADVFPVEAGEETFNKMLPSIVVGLPSSDMDLSSVSVHCQCDGNAVAIRRQPYSQFDDDGEGMSSILLSLEKSSVPHYVHHGNIQIVYQPENKVLLDYFFSVIPVRSPHIVSLDWQFGKIRARYELIPNSNVTITRDGISEAIRAHLPYTFYAPLADSNTHLVICDDSHAPLEVSLQLAGIHLALNNIDLLPSCHTMNLGDVLSPANRNAQICIQTAKTHRSRGILLMLGNSPVYYTTEKLSSSRTIRLYELAEQLIPSPNHLGKLETHSLQARIMFGHDEEGSSAAELSLIDLEEGFGTGSAFIMKGEGEPYVHFEHAPTHPMSYAFLSQSGEVLGKKYTMDTLQQNIPIPRTIWRNLERKAYFLRLSPKGRLGNIDTKHSHCINLAVMAQREKGAVKHGSNI